MVGVQFGKELHSWLRELMYGNNHMISNAYNFAVRAVCILQYPSTRVDPSVWGYCTIHTASDCHAVWNIFLKGETCSISVTCWVGLPLHDLALRAYMYIAIWERICKRSHTKNSLGRCFRTVFNRLSCPGLYNWDWYVLHGIYNTFKNLAMSYYYEHEHATLFSATLVHFPMDFNTSSIPTQLDIFASQEWYMCQLVL